MRPGALVPRPLRWWARGVVSRLLHPWLAPRLEGIAPPLIIGASGGSGTRLLVRIVGHAGIYMGGPLNHAGDSKPVGHVLIKWLPRYLARGDRPLSRGEQRALHREIEVALVRHRRGIPSQAHPWGVKDPRTLHLLPYWAATFPAMRYIHLIRDGRDMALSSNQKQLERYAHHYIGQEETSAAPERRAIAFWSRLNLTMGQQGEALLGDRYRRLRFEDLCAQPERVVTDLFDWLGVGEEGIPAAVAEIAPPPSIGRWRRLDPTLQGALHETAAEALTEFGYLPEPAP